MANNVVDFYRNKTILLTGGTGFLGKIIIEKLLRVCDVQEIFLLVRKKNGVSPYERVQHIFQEPIFDVLKEWKVDLTRKIQIIEGDLSKKQLGLSDVDIQTIVSKVNIIFHCGASLNMTSNLTEATTTNVKSTSDFLDIISNAKKLEAFVLVSTAYSACLEDIIKEKFYDTPISPDLLIKLATDMKPEILEKITKDLIFPYPNTYVYTKAVAESLLKNKGQNLPVAMLRPVVVTSTAKEPIPGWSDNLYGPLGILLSKNCGILKVIPGDPDIAMDSAPVDMTVNALLCLAWDVHNKWKQDATNYETPILNFSGNQSNLYVPLQKYSELAQNGANIGKFSHNFAIPLLIVKNWYLFCFAWFVLHTIPAFFVDSLYKLTGRKPKLRKLYSKLEKVTVVLDFFVRKQWDVENKNVVALWNRLDEKSKETFNFDVSNLDTRIYFRNLVPGLKKYILKEDLNKASKIQN